MYASFYDAAMGLNDEDFREYILALKDYALYGIEYVSQSTMVNALLVMAQPLLEAAAKRRAKQVKNGEYGILGGRPRKGETAEEYKARKAKTLNNPVGFQLETLNVDVNVKGKEDVEVNEDEKSKGDWNVKEDADANADGERENEIIKTTNVVTENNSISTNMFSSITSTLESTTRTREKPGAGTRPQPKDLSYSSNLEEGTKHGEEPRKEERARQAGNNGSKGSDFIRSITLADQDDDAPLTPPSDQYLNYVGQLEDILRYDAEPDYDGMTDADMMDAIKRDIDAAITCERREGTSQRYRDHIHRAKRIYMHLNGCDEDSAKRGITRLYREMEKEF